MCGIAGIFAEKPIKMLDSMYFMMLANQHRGQEASGIVLSDGESPIGQLHFRRLAGGVNSVNHLFSKKDLVSLEGRRFFLALGHNRYSTAGSVAKNENVQPLLAKTRFGEIAIAHNGNIPNADELKEELEKDGDIFMSDSDTEVILKLISRSRRSTPEEAIMEAVQRVRLSYSLIFMTRDKMIALRDPYGIRPLSLGSFDHGYVISSEPCAFSASKGMKFVRELRRGEMLVISKDGTSSLDCPDIPQNSAHCIFELIYFARPDSFMFGQQVAEFRMKTGLLHAKRYQINVDAVVPIPDSANFFAQGHARGLGVPLSLALLRNHYSGRTFINPGKRDIDIKLSPIRSLIKGVRLAVDDDSIVRSNTSRAVIRLMRTCRPAELHFCVACPPIFGYCPYGIDIKNSTELATHGRDVEDIRTLIDANTLNYLGMEDLRSAVPNPDDFCYGCFGGGYVS